MNIPVQRISEYEQIYGVKTTDVSEKGKDRP
jgi:hypothetical protein